MACCGDDRKARKCAHRRHEPVRRGHRYEYGGPTVRGDVYPLLDSGTCYRVVCDKKWYLYNDTLDCEMRVNFSFQPETSVRKLKHSRAESKKSSSKWTDCSAVVYPLETLPFVSFPKRTVDGFRGSVVSRPLTKEYIETRKIEAEALTAKELRAVAKVAGHALNEEELLYKCRKSKLRFVDLYFKPDALSVKRDTDKKAVKGAGSITWRRPEDYIPAAAHSKIKLFHRGIEPGDIEQGQLGDCWLMCSIAVVAESTAMIKDMFRHPVSSSKLKKEQAAGAYRVYLNKCGWWRNVIVDSYLPTLNCALCFGRSSRDPYELWVSVLEKAYAKVHGSYASIVGGDALNALQDLTGFPVHSFAEVWKEAALDEEKASLFFKDLLRYRKKRYLISLGTPGQDNSAYNADNGPKNEAAFEERYRNAGLGLGHAYSVMEVRQFLVPRVKLLKIRNPWGNGTEWTGAWGNTSEKWRKHPLVRHSCKPSVLADGTFWMEWKDVVRYFDGGGVCMVKKAWYDYRFRGQFIDIFPTFALKVEVKKRQKVFLTLSQKDRRLLDRDDPEQLYKGFLIAASCYNKEKQMQEVTAISSSNPEHHPPGAFSFIVKRDIGMELEMHPENSPYYVVPRIMVAHRFGPKDFTLGMLTPFKSTEKGLRVSFVKLSNECPIFKNIPTFPVVEEKPVSMRFQYKKRGGIPRMKDGITAFGATNVKEEFPFPY